MARSTAATNFTVPSAGVITSWSLNRYGASSVGMVSLIVGTRSEDDYLLNVVTPYQRVDADTIPSFSARIPVSAGQRLGVNYFHGSALMCNTGDAEDIIRYESSSNEGLVAGTTITSTSTIPGSRSVISAVLEPDVDGDGYGDESQDKCPQSALYVDACPVLAISQQLSFKKNVIRVLAASSVDASLTAVATIKLPNAKKSSKSKKSKKAKKTASKTVTITAKPTIVTAGKLRTIKLNLPSSVKKLLKKTKKQKPAKLTANVTLSGSGLANSATVSGKIRLK